MAFWLLKSEPEEFGWNHLLEEGRTVWNGIRNYQARNFLRQMAPGDKAFFYHSGKSPEIVGLAAVISHPYGDPTAEDPDRWSAVDIEPLELFARPVPLSWIKTEPLFSDFLLVKNSRLSVMPVPPEIADRIIQYSQADGT